MPGENPVLNWSWTGQLRNTVRVTVQTGGGREQVYGWETREGSLEIRARLTRDFSEI